MDSLDGDDIQNYINSQGDGAGEANVLADANDAMNEAAAEADAPRPPAYNGDGTTNSAYGEQDDSADPQNPDQQYASDSTIWARASRGESFRLATAWASLIAPIMARLSIGPE